MGDDREKLEKSLRELVGAMYRDLHGAYGGADYEGQYERQIQDIVDAFERLLDLAYETLLDRYNK